MTETLVRTTVRLPAELLKDAKVKAIRDGKTLQDLITAAIRSYVKGGKR